MVAQKSCRTIDPLLSNYKSSFISNDLNFKPLEIHEQNFAHPNRIS